MKQIEQQILNYRQLSSDERAAVEAYVDEHPEWAPLLRDVKQLEALAREARLFEALDAEEDVLAYYVVARHFHSGGHAPSLQKVFRKLEERLEADAALQARRQRFEARLEAVLDTVDPVAHFERLTDRQLDGPSLAAPDLDSGGENGAPSTSKQDRSPQSSGAWAGRRVQRMSRWVGVAAVVLAALYGVLFTASTLSQTDVEELALIAMSETELEGYSVRTRSASPSPDETGSTDALYRQALATLRAAQTSTLGLFPRFDEQGLRTAEDLLQKVVRREEENSFLQLEAYFFLGKVHLAQRKLDTARAHFKRVVAGEGRRAADASAILKRLQQIAPAEHGATPMFDTEDTLPTG